MGGCKGANPVSVGTRVGTTRRAEQFRADELGAGQGGAVEVNPVHFGARDFGPAHIGAHEAGALGLGFGLAATGRGGLATGFGGAFGGLSVRGSHAAAAWRSSR